jgi:hypothetical protein
MKNILKTASITFYALCSTVVVSLVVAFCILADERETISGYILMCGLPMLLATFALFLNFRTSVKENIRKPSLKWLIAVPPAIVGLYIVYILLVIIVMGISFLAVTIYKA